MYPFHLAGALARAEDPQESRNRVHLVALRELDDADRRTSVPVRPSFQVQRIAFPGGWTSRSADFGAAGCA